MEISVEQSTLKNKWKRRDHNYLNFHFDLCFCDIFEFINIFAANTQNNTVFDGRIKEKQPINDGEKPKQLNIPATSFDIIFEISGRDELINADVSPAVLLSNNRNYL